MWHFIMVSTIRACVIRLSLFSGCWDHFLKVKSGTQSWETESVWRLTEVREALCWVVSCFSRKWDLSKNPALGPWVFGLSWNVLGELGVSLDLQIFPRDRGHLASRAFSGYLPIGCIRMRWPWTILSNNKIETSSSEKCYVGFYLFQTHVLALLVSF